MVGVDGARRGWVGVCWDGARVEPVVAPTLVELCRAAGDVAVVAVDMPIELATDGPRPCDVAARPLLGRRRSSLFAPPVLDALGHATYAEANAWSKARTGHGISKQAWMLAPKIREVRRFAEETSLPLYETFPELSFRGINRDEPLTSAKRTWTGLAARLGLLRSVGIELPVDAGAAGEVGADDLVDAAALAWSAWRIAHGDARCLPPDAAEGEPAIWW